MFNTLVEMFDSIVAKSPNAVAQMGKTAKGAFIPKTYKELQKEVKRLRARKAKAKEGEANA